MWPVGKHDLGQEKNLLFTDFGKWGFLIELSKEKTRGVSRVHKNIKNGQSTKRSSGTRVIIIIVLFYPRNVPLEHDGIIESFYSIIVYVPAGHLVGSKKSNRNHYRRSSGTFGALPILIF